jgi:hypothetical protein
MTACAIETAPEGGAVRRPGFTIAADGSYAARLAGSGEAWFPERWTLDGPEPYAVPLPADQPEEPGTEVLPLADGRVLIHREAMGRHLFSLLYPTGPATGELPLGAVEFGAGPLTLLPPAPGGGAAYALAVGARSTALWLVAGGAFGPEHVAEVEGRCTGGVWLDRTGRMLALDRETEGPGGPVVKSVAVDLERGGEVTPLLQIAERSNDRLLLADPDSGLLVIRSDAPGEDRLGWGVLGSTRPVRFPESLRVGACTVTPFAAQPGQVLMPESCAVAVRIDRQDRSAAPVPSWVGMWRPTDGRLHQLAAPVGWLAGSGLWTREGVLRLPFVTDEVPCGVAQVCAPPSQEDMAPGMPPAAGVRAEEPGSEERGTPAGDGPAGNAPAGAAPTAWRPVPLQQATLTGRLHRIGTRPKAAADTSADSAPTPPETPLAATASPPPVQAPPASYAAVPASALPSAPMSAPASARPSAHAAAPEMVRMTVPIRIPVPAPTPPTGDVTPLNEPRPGD